MSEINLEGKVPQGKNGQTTFSIEGDKDMPIEELIKRIRNKIERVQRKKAQELSPYRE